jgi:hypothetical protein
MDKSKNPFAKFEDGEYKVDDIRVAKAHDKRKYKRKRMAE